jgi:hypothetical protein
LERGEMRNCSESHYARWQIFFIFSKRWREPERISHVETTSRPLQTMTFATGAWQRGD